MDGGREGGREEERGASAPSVLGEDVRAIKKDWRR